jgi:integral membrane protein
MSAMTKSGNAILRGVRVLGTIEGVSFLVLMLFAMPMKYLYGQPIFVKWFGWAHGILFIALGLQTLVAWRARVIGFATAFQVMVAALLPTGPFFMDRKLRRLESADES